MPDQMDPLAAFFAKHSPVNAGEDIETGWVDCSCGRLIDQPTAVWVAHMTEAMRAAFPAEYGVEDQNGVGFPHPHGATDGGLAAPRFYVGRCSGSRVVARPVLPWHPIKETP